MSRPVAHLLTCLLPFVMQGLFSRKKRVQGVQEAVPAKLQFGEGECTPGAVTVSVRVGEGAALDGKGLDRIDRIDRIDDDDGPVDVAHGEPGGQEEEEGEEAPPSPSQRASVHRIYTVPPDTSTHLEPLDVDDMDDPLEVVLGYCLDTVLSNESKKNENWQERVQAMETLTRLALGGAAGVPYFLQEMNASQHILESQLNDRRSAVSKQACLLVSVLAWRGGLGVKGLLLALQPSLLKLHGVSIAVMSQAGH